jgi:FtsP/CotA-like multicopper oxidase with cupredoxin domain
LLTRRQFIQTSSLSLLDAAAPADYTIEIAPCSLELSPRVHLRTTAYNGQAPGPLLRMQEGKPISIDVINRTSVEEVVHWHGLFLPSEIDGAMEEGTPPIKPNERVRYVFTPRPAGFRWYHTHSFAGRDLNKGQYTGQHGFLLIEPRENPGRYDAEFFLALHDWKGQLLASDDGSMNPTYEASTINGRALGFGDPLRVRAGQSVVMHILNSSATDCHWLAIAGHEFQVFALDGNPVPQPRPVSMLRLAPAERVSALVRMNNPGVWILGEVRKHIQAAGMGIVIEYAGQSGPARWHQPEALVWNYLSFADPNSAPPPPHPNLVEIPLSFKSKFAGHGDLDHWTINGKSFPHTDVVTLQKGRRYRLLLKNESTDHHPIHLHRHLFEISHWPGQGPTHGITKDTVLVDANTQVNVEFTASDPGMTLFHCHQQDHMDMGFMMLFRYAES